MTVDLDEMDRLRARYIRLYGTKDDEIAWSNAITVAYPALAAELRALRKEAQINRGLIARQRLQHDVVRKTLSGTYESYPPFNEYEDDVYEQAVKVMAENERLNKDVSLLMASERRLADENERLLARAAELEVALKAAPHCEAHGEMIRLDFVPRQYANWYTGSRQAALNPEGTPDV